MPGFGVVFDERRIDRLVEYLREVSNPPPSRPDTRQASAPRAAVPEPVQARRQLEEMVTRDYRVALEVVVEDDLQTPWAIDFLDPGRALITEKPGRLRWLVGGRLDPRPIEGLPEVVNQGQGGLMDVAFDPEYGDGQNDWVYLSFTHGIDGRERLMTKIVRGKIDGHQWNSEEVLFEADHDDYLSGGLHFGSRIVFDRAGRLYFCIGERGRREHAQRLDKPNGKVHRINRDGSIPADNPFAAMASDGSVYPSIYSLGHRNPQGLAVLPETDELWLTEHGPKGGDELNIARPGRNYGWPEITYGINYIGTTITDAYERDGLEQPILYWIPSIAVCGLDVYGVRPIAGWPFPSDRALPEPMPLLRSLGLTGPQAIAGDLLHKPQTVENRHADGLNITRSDGSAIWFDAEPIRALQVSGITWEDTRNASFGTEFNDFFLTPSANGAAEDGLWPLLDR